MVMGFLKYYLMALAFYALQALLILRALTIFMFHPVKLDALTCERVTALQENSPA